MRGNIDYDQVREAARDGDGVQFQMSGVSIPAPVAGDIAVYDSGGNLISSATGLSDVGGAGYTYHKVTFDLNDTTTGPSVTPAVPILIDGASIEMVIICKLQITQDLKVQFNINLNQVATLIWPASNNPYDQVIVKLTDLSTPASFYVPDKAFWTIDILTSDGTKNAHGVATAVVAWKHKLPPTTFSYYVDPTGGDDSNNGMSKSTAFLTTAPADALTLTGTQSIGYLFQGTWVLYRYVGMTDPETTMTVDLMTATCDEY